MTATSAAPVTTAHIDRSHFDQQYQTHLKHLKLKGLQPKTIDAYSRAIRRIGKRFDYQIDSLTEAYLTGQTKHHAIERINGLMGGFAITWGLSQMIRLASVIDAFADGLRTQYGSQLSSAHLQALAAMRRCRTQASAKMQVQCTGCAHQTDRKSVV